LYPVSLFPGGNGGVGLTAVLAAVGRMLVVVVRGREGGVAVLMMPVMVVSEWNCCYYCNQQSHMIMHLTRISAPRYPCIPMTQVQCCMGSANSNPYPYSCTP
jgi:hypothetical protein